MKKEQPQSNIFNVGEIRKEGFMTVEECKREIAFIYESRKVENKKCQEVEVDEPGY